MQVYLVSYYNPRSLLNTTSDVITILFALHILFYLKNLLNRAGGSNCLDICKTGHNSRKIGNHWFRLLYTSFTVALWASCRKSPLVASVTHNLSRPFRRTKGLCHACLTWSYLQSNALTSTRLVFPIKFGVVPSSYFCDHIHLELPRWPKLEHNSNSNKCAETNCKKTIANYFYWRHQNTYVMSSRYRSKVSCFQCRSFTQRPWSNIMF